MDINHSSGRKLNKSLLQRLATCEYITEHRNIFITGATGGDNSTIADAILDRIVHDAYKINIESTDSSKDISMREIYGLDRMLSE